MLHDDGELNPFINTCFKTDFRLQSKYELAVEDCTASVELDPRYVKAYMRRAQAYENLEDLDAALADIKKALEVDSTYPAARKSTLDWNPL